MQSKAIQKDSYSELCRSWTRTENQPLYCSISCSTHLSPAQM